MVDGSPQWGAPLPLSPLCLFIYEGIKGQSNHLDSANQAHLRAITSTASSLTSYSRLNACRHTMSRYYHPPMTREEMKAANAAAIKALTSRAMPPCPPVHIPKEFVPIYTFLMQEKEKDRIATEEERKQADEAKHRAEMAEVTRKMVDQYSTPQDGPLLASPPLFFASAMAGPVPLPVTRHELSSRSASDEPPLANPPLFFASAMAGPVSLPAPRQELRSGSASVSPARRRRGYHPGPLSQHLPTPDVIIPFDTQVQQPNFFSSSSMPDHHGHLQTQVPSTTAEVNHSRSRPPASARSRSPVIIP